MIFSHRSLLDKLYPLISGKKLGGEHDFILTLQKRFLKNFLPNFLKAFLEIEF